MEKSAQPIEILIVEDNPGDARLAVEALTEGKIANKISIVEDGVEAISFLRRENGYSDAPRPDLILLDLNLPKMNGKDVLAIIKKDLELKRIPVVILTTSDADQDIFATYELHANCYITKPVDFDQFINVIQSVENFWLSVVILPK
ncbi:MAG: response regulator [Thermodesulfobacteriota bacterium]